MSAQKENKPAQKKVMMIVLLMSAALLFLTSFIISDSSLINVMRIVASASLIGLVITRFVNIGGKPTLEEIEKNQFGDKQ